MFEDPELDRIDNWQAGFEHRAAQARELAARLATLTATAATSNGDVKVTVGPDGTMTALELTEQTRRQPAAETARQILTTLTEARRDLTARATTVTAETVGADSETGKAVIASLTRRQQ